MKLTRRNGIKAACVAALFALAAACSPTINTDGLPPVPGENEQCGGMVDLHVVNQNPGAVRLFFDGWNRLKAVEGLAEETVRVPRYVLRSAIGMQVARGGEGTALVEGGVVECNDATLVIGSPLRISFFFGADVRGR